MQKILRGLFLHFEVNSKNTVYKICIYDMNFDKFKLSEISFLLQDEKLNIY